MKSRAIPLVLLFTTAGVYIHNLSRSVYGGDVGDLITSAFVGGVPHAPGYPLFTLLGFLLTRFHFVTPAFQVGLVSALSGAIGILMFFLTIRFLTKNSLVALISSLSLAFSFYYWFYAEIAEVFALNNLFALTLLYLVLLLRKKPSKKLFFFFLFTLGLSCTNHQTIVLLLPSLVVLLLKQKKYFRFNSIDYKSILGGIYFFLLGFSVYLYVPIASLHNPVINWDHVRDLNSFLHLILRKDYGTFAAGSFAAPTLLQRLVILKTYGFDILTQVTIPVVSLALLGSIFLWKKDRLLLASLWIGFFLTGPVFISYAGFPLFSTFLLGVYERFFILSTLFIFLLFPFGLVYLGVLLRPFIHKQFMILIYIVFLLIPVLLFSKNFPKTNLSTVNVGNNLGYDILNPLPKNSVLFLGGDTILFNTWYVHYVLGVRPDVQIININALPFDAYFLKAQKEFQQKNPKAKDDALLFGTIKQIASRHPLVALAGFQPKGEQWTWIPEGLTVRLLNGDKPEAQEYKLTTYDIWKKMHIPKGSQDNLANGSLSLSDIPSVYSNALLTTGTYIITAYSDSQTALSYYMQAVVADPHNYKALEMVGVYYTGVDKDCFKAEDYLTRSIQENPFEKNSYFFLYTVFKDCLENTRLANKVKEKYTKTFQSDLFEDARKSTQSAF